MKKCFVVLLSILCLAGCGGGGSSGVPTPTPGPTKEKLVGEVYSSPAELATSELKVNAGYTGNLATSRAIKAAGMASILDLLFMAPVADSQGNLRSVVAPDTEQKLIQYANDNKDLLAPGARVLIIDEVFADSGDTADSVVALERQLVAINASVALVRKYLPQASVGITASPYAAQGKQNTKTYILKAVALVDWVGTDPYWYGDPSNIRYLHEWSSTFHGLAKQANPKVETLFVAQAFKFSTWDLAVFNSFIAEELGYAEQYDGMVFFGWQFVSEIDIGTAGKFFPTATKQLYKKYLK
ncbi:MAG: hypothetical protein NT159_14950 [Proteobacteria bacterium]|nr:hypothetical protein [Pseudomonadota bacterium]